MTTCPDPSPPESPEERADSARSFVLDEDPTLRRIVDIIVEALDPEQVILFGSRARGDDTAKSDYDLCVIADSEQPYHERNVQVHRLFPRRDFSMDAFVLTPEEYDAQRQVVNTLGFYVDRDGEVLYERS
jgi:predicted nucleotidyltransferase